MTKEVTSDRPRSRGRLWLLTGVILILLPCLGLGGGFAYLRLWNAGALSRWRRLPALPADGIEIVAGNTTTVYVRAADANLYGCRHRGGTEVPKNCWFEAQQPLDVDLDHWSENRLYQGEVKPPAGTVVDGLDVTVWYAESASETRYALMQDGSVYKWEYDTGIYGSLIKLAIGPIIGFLVAVVAVVALWVRRGLRARRGRS